MSTSATLNKGLDILELLGERGDLRIQQIGEVLGLSRATAFRLVAALEERGYVEHDVQARTYRLALKVTELGAASQASSLSNFASGAMAELRASTGETINLGVIRRDRIIYEDIVDGTYSLRLSARVGDSAPPHATAMGKAILAVISPERRERLLPLEPYEAFTQFTITTYQKLELDLGRSMRRGYAIDDQETELGARCVATPIVAGSGRPLGALSISAITARVSRDDLPRLGRLLVECTNSISEKMERGGAVDGRPAD